METTGHNASRTLDEGSGCLTEEIRHQYEFMRAGNGESVWKCTFCGFWYHEFEDSQP